MRLNKHNTRPAVLATPAHTHSRWFQEKIILYSQEIHPRDACSPSQDTHTLLAITFTLRGNLEALINLKVPDLGHREHENSI